MKCLVFSDSHGESFYFKKALSLHPDAEVVFFLGDGLSDADIIAENEKGRMWIAVRGNCDFRNFFLGREVEKSEEIEILGRKIALTHGDLYGVKGGTAGIEAFAEAGKADIVLFGHTHAPMNQYISSERPFYLFNPGSLHDYPHSYGILTLTDNSVLFSHGRF